ncbi:birA, biotin-(acetyl-CoA-carboxylase) ligase [Synechococcus sp. PCC 7502]|uniref:biotin--[acetyl-CoA-carboxylase] ligase n=1 Tax=Synechococcus sp. PCC 7502 TaxID=1173263 RepID=UPI00029F83CC|nr:biotin--[acetyl-CoA-carboxylase] ligase [Synechococcus sp. PCC 7502]AFY74152.1 birA, biotin-(acetyl-CoA-carboxylase) ligase [Synechococcus sp. PCC 7502]
MPSNFQVIYYESLDSTNSEAWRLIDQGIGSEGVVIVAKTQTSGRGQRDHLWQSDLGGLYLSVIFQPQQPAQAVAQMTIWSAWGIANALRTVVPDLKIKWLNDLVVANRKLGGILTETRVTGGIITHAVLGVGINWLNEVPTVGIALADLASNVENLETLESLVLSGINQGWHYWQDQGIDAILPKYLQLLSSYSVQVGDRSGTIIAVTSAGDLVVQWHNNLGTSTLMPGSISLGYGISDCS